MSWGWLLTGGGGKPRVEDTDVKEWEEWDIYHGVHLSLLNK